MFRGVPASEQAIERERQKDLTKVKLPKSFDKPVDIAAVNKDVIKVWVAQELERVMPGDDILVDYTIELLEDPDIKSIYLQLKGFLGDKALPFCTKLWDLLLTAQADPDGIPPELVKLKLEEIQRQDEHRHRRPRSRSPKRDTSEYGRSRRDGSSKHDRMSRRDRSSSFERHRESRERRDVRERGNGREQRDSRERHRRDSHERRTSRERYRGERRSDRHRSPSRDRFGRDRSERRRYSRYTNE